jgi:hypothetical protein
MVNLSSTICDDPVPAVQHDSLVTLVADSYAVREKELTQLRPRLRRHVVAANAMQTKEWSARAAGD